LSSCSAASVPTSVDIIFPCTTLFRSLQYVSNKHTWRSRSPFCGGSSHICERTEHSFQRTFLQRQFVYCPYHRGSPIWSCYYLSLQDRKSTRLNSSHVWISYTVFCLKTKIK